MICSAGWIECHPGTAAWVQAIGAILAIGAGILLLHYQATLQRRNRLRAVCALVEMAVTVVTRRLEVPEEFGDAFDFFVMLNTEEIRFAYNSLCAIPLHEIDSASAVLQVGAAIEIMRRILAQLESDRIMAMSHPTERAVVGTAFTEDVDHLMKASQKLSKLA